MMSVISVEIQARIKLRKRWRAAQLFINKHITFS